MGATFSRLKNWVAELLTYADLNAEIDNILSNLTPAGTDDYSSNATAMRTTTDPGESGTESLATSLAGEIERLRFAIKEMKGSDVDYWYESASTSLTEIASAVGTTTISNRITSGRMRTGSSQPLFLVPHGAARTVTLKGATTNFIYSIAGTSYTISTDVTLTSLTLAPSSNNTCLVNMAGIAGQFWTKTLGEYGSSITVDAMGSEISNLTGKLVGIKIAGAATEYAIARVESSTLLTNIQRGYFFDSTDAPIPRTTISDNDTITLMKLSWIFATTAGALAVCYTNPTVSGTEPTSPAIGDYWYDTATTTWKTYSAGSVWVSAAATLVGVCMQDTANTIAGRGFDFFKNHLATNSAKLERLSNTVVRTEATDSEVSIYGTKLNFFPDRLTWDIASHLDSGVTETASTHYFMYLKENGNTVLSNLAPMDRTADLKGLYHPFHTWRCLGQYYNDDSSNIAAVIDYGDLADTNYKITSQVAANALTVVLHSNPLVPFVLNSGNSGASLSPVRVPYATSLLINSSSTLGHTNALQYPLYFVIMRSSGGVGFLAVSTKVQSGAGLLTSSAEGGGTATSASTLYSLQALTTVPAKQIGTSASTQTTAGTWATGPNAVVTTPMKHGDVFVTRYTSGSGTHTTALGCAYLIVTAVGGGAGGTASGTTGSNAGANGGNTTFGSLLTAGGGSGAAGESASAGAGGTVSVSAPAITLFSTVGARGGGASFTASSGASIPGGSGGNSPLGGNGASGYGAVAGSAAAANSGSGGGGGGAGVTGNSYTGVGGSAGGFIRIYVPAPATSYSYAVGAAGTGGSAGTNGAAGGDGGAGLIVVEEYFT